MKVLIAETLVADEANSADASDRSLVDLEDEVDPVLRQLDDLGNDRRRKTPRPAVNLEDALNVGLHLGAREDYARSELLFLLQIFGLLLSVALIDHAIDDRVFHHGHVEDWPFLLNRHVGEQPGREERLQRLVDARRAHGVAG